MKLILTCEHGGNTVPIQLAHIFKNNSAVLETHSAFDLGALDLFNALKPLSETSFYSKQSRLLIELNRSLHHPKLFSTYSKALSKVEQRDLIKTYTLYRNSVETCIKKLIDAHERVIHISVHSFTPILNSVERNCDIGLLFDSRISQEKAVCKRLKQQLSQENSLLKIRYNYPYLGKSDGFITYLRKQFPDHYIGIELEINQKYSDNNIMTTSIKTAVFNALQSLDLN